MTLKAVIFDLDGTITDTIPLTVHSLKEVTKQLTGKTLTDRYILDNFGPMDTEIIKTFVDNDKSEISPDMYLNHFSDNFDSFVKPMDGITELLCFIKAKGLKVALFTGRSTRGADIILEKLNIRQYFDEILAGDSTTNPKPDPEGILLSLKKLGIKPSEGMYVGDFAADIKASKAAGTMSVLALWSSTGSEELMVENVLFPDQF